MPLRRAPGGAIAAAGSRTSTWLCIDSSGEQATVKADKRNLNHKFNLSIPVRDMRLLDSSHATSHRGSIAVREGAIVFAIEHVQLIITASSAILPVPRGSADAALFAEALTASVQEAAAARTRMEDFGEDALSLDSGSAQHSFNPDLPYQAFELIVLEAALKEMCNSYDLRTKQLEAKIRPVCESLLKKVTTSTLEILRRLKTRHQRLLSTVATLRTELESFLQDDDDITKMCLTLATETSQLTTSASIRSNQRRLHSSSSGGIVVGCSPDALSRALSRSLSSGQRSPRLAEQVDVEESVEAMENVENLLEFYFVQIDRSFDRLTTLEEDMKDCESYVNFDLDSNQNRLFRLDIMITIAAFSVEIFHVFAGILGENVPIPKQITETQAQFWIVNFATLAICLLVFLGLYSYLKFKRLLL